MPSTKNIGTNKAGKKSYEGDKKTEQGPLQSYMGQQTALKRASKTEKNLVLLF
jgi:hypothetical protein